jgi:hypothetical protein
MLRQSFVKVVGKLCRKLFAKTVKERCNGCIDAAYAFNQQHHNICLMMNQGEQVKFILPTILHKIQREQILQLLLEELRKVWKDNKFGVESLCGILEEVDRLMKEFLFDKELQAEIATAMFPTKRDERDFHTFYCR